MSLNIGLNVVEVDGRATPSIQSAPTSVTGFTIRSQRGIPGEVVQVTNWSQFLEHFGAYRADAYGAYAVRGFFDNGGTTAHVTRVENLVAGTAVSPSITSNPGPWALTSGDTLVFNTNLDPNPLTVTFTANGAMLVGQAGPFDLDDGGGTGQIISLDVNGVIRGPYQFLAADFAGGLGAATAAEAAAVLNREFAGIQAWVEAGNLQVRTDRQGNSAALTGSGTAAVTLGLDGTANGGGNVANMDAVTPAAAAAAITAVLNPVGLIVSLEEQQIKIAHPTVGVASTIQVDAASTLDTTFGFDNALHTGTDGNAAAAAAAAALTLGDLTVHAGYRGQEDVGAWGNSLTIEAVVNSEDNTLFDLIVRRDNNGVPTELDRLSGLNMIEASRNFAETRINDEFSGSKFIVVEATGVNNPPATAATPLTGGRDGTFADRAAELTAYAASIDLFDLVDIQLLLCPEAHESEVVTKALTHCETKGDRMFIGHTQFNHDAAAAKAFSKAGLQGNKVYGALYFPWIRVADPLGGQKWIPPTGHTAGVYARTERERGIWKAPAGNAARVNGALDVRYHITDVDHTDLVKNGSVNAVRFVSGQGIVIDSSRTLSTNPLWLYVNVRLLFNFVKSSLKDGLRWVVQEPNDDTLWNKVKFNSVTPFLMGLWRRGAFGPGAPDEVFTVKIDAENNTPANIQQGILTLEVYFYPSRPAETIVIVVGQQEGGGTANEG